MTDEPGNLVRRLGLSVLVAAVLSLVFDLATRGSGFPTGMELIPLGLDFVLIAAIYAFVIPGLYFVCAGAGKIGIRSGIVFPVLFVALYAAWSYVSPSGFGLHEIGAGILVGGRPATSHAWSYLEQNIAGMAAIALIIDIILFGWPSRWILAGVDL